MAWTWTDPATGRSWASHGNYAPWSSTRVRTSTIGTGAGNPTVNCTPPAPDQVEQLREALRSGLSVNEAADACKLARGLARAVWENEVLGTPEPTTCPQCAGTGRVPLDQMSEDICRNCRGQGIGP